MKTPSFPGYQTLAARALMRLVTGKKITPTTDPVGRTAKYGRYSIKPEVQVLGGRLDKFIEVVEKIESCHPQAANLGG